MSEVVEVVVISGPRRGEICEVDLEKGIVTDEEALDVIHRALQELDRAVVDAIDEVKSLNAELRSSTERMRANGKLVGDLSGDRIGNAARE